jgi:putative peptide zinc metalloprotease protein
VTALSFAGAAAPRPWPVLRDDLTLHPGPVTAEGAPTWTLHDAAANRFYRIGWLEFEILSRWGLGDVEAVARAVSRETPIRITPAHIEAFIRFAERYDLFQARGAEATARLLKQVAATKHHFLYWLLKNYLFLRIPLVHPDGFLAATLPGLGWVFSRGFLWAIAALAGLGLFLIGHQWESFTHSFAFMVTPEGAALTGAALIFAKVVHELGHGYAARRFGCRVPAMGVALMVLWPVLWTDTTEAWKLPSRRSRLIIDGAGIIAELALAAGASVLWSFLPDGPLRTGVHLLATTTWFATLLVNLNPFMRFDGYFLVADSLDIANLQDRSFALARWWLREALFGLGDPPPELFPPGRRRLLIAYALATWIYRFFLFLGIALLVYYLFFKLLGLFLFAVELGWFILRPIALELRIWARRRAVIGWNRRSAVTLTLLAGAVGLFFVPWQSRVSAPALLRAEQQSVLYAPRAARLATVAAANGQAVREGEVLFVLENPDLGLRIAATEQKLRAQQTQIAVQTLEMDLAQRNPVAWQELEGTAAELEALLAQRHELTVRAPADGVLTEVPAFLKPGGWVAVREPLAMVLSAERRIVEAFVPEEDLGRLQDGADGRFYGEAGDRAPLAVRLSGIDRTATRELDYPDLASTHGGGVAVRSDSGGRLIPEQSVYRVNLEPADGVVGAGEMQAIRGTVVIAADEVSWAARMLRIAMGVLIRESGW